MHTPDIFKPKFASEIDRMVARHPLALVISAVDGEIEATPLPIVLLRDETGGGMLVGHFSRNNPQVALIRREKRATIAFTGASGYIASSWLSERKYAPTWNYEAVHFKVEIELDDSPEAAKWALDTLVAHVEADYPNPWRVEESPRHAQLATMIVPFRATIRDTQVQFKLGQGDSEGALQDTYAALARYHNYELANAMRRLHSMEAGLTEQGVAA